MIGHTGKTYVFSKVKSFSSSALGVGYKSCRLLTPAPGRCSDGPGDARGTEQGFAGQAFLLSRNSFFNYFLKVVAVGLSRCGGSWCQAGPGWVPAGWATTGSAELRGALPRSLLVWGFFNIFS